MAFEFSLSAVLRVRGILEEQEERLLQKILFEIGQALEALDRTNDEIAAVGASRHADVFKRSIAGNLHASYGEVIRLKQRRKDLEAQLEKLEQLRIRQVLAYNAARRNREMLTDMREEKRDVYETDVTRREQKVLDDNYIARRGRI